MPPETENQGTQFFERLQLSFGDAKDKELQQNLERNLGLKGKLDIGDIADVVGGSLPFIGSILGGAGGTIAGAGVGAVPGAAIGASTGEAVKQTIGQLAGVRQNTSPTSEALRPLVTGGLTYLGGKGIQKAGSGISKILSPLSEKIPEKLYSQIFQRTEDDVRQLLRSEAMLKIQSEKPELFNKFVQEKIIRLKNNKLEVNPTLAQEVLQRGLFGSDEAMTKYGFVKQFQLESEIRNILSKTKARVPLAEKRAFLNLLGDVSKEFSRQGRGFFSDRVKDANKIAFKLRQTKGNAVDPGDALELRRFLDGMRNTGSFRLNPNLSQKQEAFKKAADILRSRLAKIPEIGQKMNEYRIWIEAVDSLVDYATKTGNRRLLNLTDVIVGGGGLAGGFPGTGVGAATLIRLFQTPTFLTGTGQALSKLGKISVPQAVKSGAGFVAGRGLRGGVRGILEQNQ